MPQIVAIANQKGGVGKTTSAIALGSVLSSQAKVLVVDLDPQGNLSSGLQMEPSEGQVTLYEVLIDNAPASKGIVGTKYGMDLLPADIGLAKGERMLTAETMGHLALKRHLVHLPYDYILIDCPPTLGTLTISALVAANTVLVPVQLQYFAVMKGLLQFIEVCQNAITTGDLRLEILGILPTMADHTRMTTDSLEVLNSPYLSQKWGKPIHIFSPVPKSVKFAESNQEGIPANLYMRGKDVAMASAYHEVAAVLLQSQPVAVSGGV